MAEFATAGSVAVLVDQTRQERPLASICLKAAATGNATLTGHFIDQGGRPVPTVAGGSTYGVTGSVLLATAQTLCTIFGLAAIPPDAVGFMGQLATQAVILSYGASTPTTVLAAIATDMQTNPTFYPQLATSTNFRLGRA